MLVTVNIPDYLAGQFGSNEKENAKQLLEAFLRQRLAEGKLPESQVKEALDPLLPEGQELPPTKNASNSPGSARPSRDVLARLRGIYGNDPMSGENAVLVARQAERY